MAVLLSTRRIGWAGVILAVVGLLEYLVIQVAVSHYSRQSKIPVDLQPLFENGQIHLQTSENGPLFNRELHPLHSLGVKNGSTNLGKQPLLVGDSKVMRTGIRGRILNRLHPLTVNPNGPEILVEKDPSRTYRQLTPLEQSGGDVLLTLRTTASYHDKRLPLLIETWMTKVDRTNIFLVTDDEDKKWMEIASEQGMHYVNAECGHSYMRDELCCKAGVEMQLLFQEGNEQYNWLCHVDDDMYILGKPLVKTLSKFNPTREPIYFGRSGSGWKEPRKVLDESTLGTPGQRYHFAVGGTYCLSRAMLELAKAYLVGGKAFAKSCSQTREPEDVTMGVVVGAVLNMSLSRTELINTHGLWLASFVHSSELAQQIAISYGYGAVKWGRSEYNAIKVPNALYSLKDDPSQFRSLHCHLYPEEEFCRIKSGSLKKS